MSQEEWQKVSRTIDFILKQPTGAAQGVQGRTEKPKQKTKKPKPQPQAEQLRLF